MSDVQQVIDTHIEQMNASEINTALKRYERFLKIDLQRDLKSAQSRAPAQSPFDDLFGGTHE